MARLPVEDVLQLWDETTERTWEALYETLLDHEEIPGGVSGEVVALLVPVVQELEEEGAPYPESPDELVDILTERMTEESE